MRHGRSLPLAVLLGHAVLVQVVSYAVRPLVSYAILDLELSAAWLGVATAAFAVPPLLLAVPSGRLVDRLGERLTLVLGACALTGASTVVLVWRHSLAGLLVATVLLGLGVLWSVLGEQAWVMRGAPAGRLDAAFGLYTFATSSGQMAGPLLLALPGGQAVSPPLGAVAWSAAAASVSCLVLSVAVRRTPRLLQGEQELVAERTVPVALRLLRTRGVVPALVMSSLVLSSLDIALAYLPLLVRERGLAPVWVPALLVARGLATMASRLALGRLTSRHGRRRVLVVGGALSALGLTALALPVPVVVLLVAMAAYGFAAGTVQPLTMSWVTLLTPRQQRGVAASLRLVGNRTGQTAIPLAVAGLSASGGASVVFAATGASLLVSVWLSRWAPDGDGPGGGPA